MKPVLLLDFTKVTDLKAREALHVSAQNCLFEMGYEWSGSSPSRTPRYLNSSYLMVGWYSDCPRWLTVHESSNAAISNTVFPIFYDATVRLSGFLDDAKSRLLQPRVIEKVIGGVKVTITKDKISYNLSDIYALAEEIQQSEFGK